MMNDYHDQKAVIYARYSSHNQTEQSIEGQLHDAYAFADRNGITIIKEYVDRALSGTKDDRPDFQKMIRDAERKQFSLVLVWKLDRFARNRHDAAIYRAKLKKYGVQIVSVMENISEGAEGILIESVLEGFAEYYSRNLAENVKRGLRENVLKGWYPGGTIPYGYIHQDHKLVPDPRCVPVIREVFERYTSGTRVKEIVDDLNSRGFYFKHGRPFTINIISRMLENTAYIGELYFGGQLVAGCATPIIDPNMFEKAAELTYKVVFNG
jgi:DNA invertase Pin-like site-specific DNA recombinase